MSIGGTIWVTSKVATQLLSQAAPTDRLLFEQFCQILSPGPTLLSILIRGFGGPPAKYFHHYTLLDDLRGASNSYLNTSKQRIIQTSLALSTILSSLEINNWTV